MRASVALHWHGVRVPNAMDGVPHITQSEVQPGQSFTYRFTAGTPGTPGPP
jgi:FtsP/CotA-like multicopper oxidase with cupredoxin domain